MSLDFTVFNIYGYVLYGIYTWTGLIFPDIGTNHVAIQDVFYCFHALALATVYFVQIQVYPNGGQKLNITSWAILGVMTIAIIIVFILEMKNIGVNKYWNTTMLWGYLKDIITVAKYTPQVYKNWKRKCTKGWNIWSPIFDTAGGVFSYLQMFIDS